MTFRDRSNKFLIEAGRKHRYMEMFKKLIPDYHDEVGDENEDATPEEDAQRMSKLKPKVQAEIAWAMKYLKREDRIIWYLRKYKASLKAIGAGKDEEDPAIQEWSESYNKKYKEDLQHYISNAETNNFKSVLDYVIPLDASIVNVLATFKKLESKDLENSNPDRLIDPDPKEKAFLKFPDGWTWYLIDAETCAREGKAMRHCGNRGNPHDGDQILSLREPVKTKKGLKLKPQLTFILNHGILGEMKGFANSKPNKKYHKYIVPLLESKAVKFVDGGGNAEDDNFSLADLDDGVRQKLLTKKPELNDLEAFEKMESLDSFDQHFIEHKLGNDFYRFFPYIDPKIDWGHKKLTFVYRKGTRIDTISKLFDSSFFSNGKEAKDVYKLVTFESPPISTGVADSKLKLAANLLKETQLEKDISETLGLKDFTEIVKEIQAKKEDPKLDYIHSILRDGIKESYPHATMQHIRSQIIKYLKTYFEVTEDLNDLRIELSLAKAFEYLKKFSRPIEIDIEGVLDKEDFLRIVEPEFKKYLQKVKRLAA